MLRHNNIDDKSTIDELLKRSWTYKNSEEFVKFLDFIARFQHYSRYNTMLVYIQNPTITFFGTSSYWQKKFGRMINTGAKAHVILVPKGPIMLVYDIFDTNGKLTATQFLESGLGSNPNKVNGNLNKGTFSSVLDKISIWGIRIVYEPLRYFNGGYFQRMPDGKLEIGLKEGMTNEESFSVLIHELAHLFLGHCGLVELSNWLNGKSILIRSRLPSPDAMELEAEAVSFLICKKLGLETRSAEYMAAFIKNDADILTFSHERVISTTDKIEKLFL